MKTVVGLAITERRDRNLWVWELGIDEEHIMVGVGRKLVDALTGLAKNLGLRVIVCETQNTNVPAIEFYRKTEFALDGIDLSYYEQRYHDRQSGDLHEKESGIGKMICSGVCA